MSAENPTISLLKSEIDKLSNEINEENNLLTRKKRRVSYLKGELRKIKIKEKNILDKKEKEYLKAVIKPFRDKVVYITKVCWENDPCVDSEEAYIKICVRDYKKTISEITLPSFKKDTMYKYMDGLEEYTLEELEL